MLLRAIVTLSVAVLLSACATTKPVPTNEEAGYSFLFEKSTRDNGCVAAFHKEGQLYLISGTNTGHPYVSIYDPRLGAFASVIGDYIGSQSCKHLLLGRAENAQYGGNRVASLYVVLPSDFRDLLDNAVQNPEALKQVITAGEPYFKYHGEDAVVSLRTPRIQLEQRYHIPELAGRLKATTKETMDRLAAPRLMELESYKKERERKIQEAKKVRENWEEARELPLTVGDQVCTFYDNYFGVVEQVVNGRVKVFVSGQAMAETGFHFRSRGGYFQSKDMNEYRWFAEDEVGPCSVN